MASDTKETISLFVQGAVSLLIAIILYLGADTRQDIKDMTKEVNSVQIELARIAGNRFTSSDGLKVWSAIHQIQNQFVNQKHLRKE